MEAPPTNSSPQPSTNLAGHQKGVLVDPIDLGQVIGQKTILRRLEVHFGACLKSHRTPEHQLFLGPPGYGKSTLARTLGMAFNRPVLTLSAVNLTRVGDLAAIFRKIQPHSLFFLDEIHCLPRQLEEFIYPIMDHNEMEFLAGQGLATRPVKIPLPPFSLLAATTKEGSLTPPLLSRFAYVHQMEPYSLEDLATILQRSIVDKSFILLDETALYIAERSLGNPRKAKNLLKIVLDQTQFENRVRLDLSVAARALNLHTIDDQGLPPLAQEYLKILRERFDGGPVGLQSLADCLNSTPKNVEEVVEPLLLRLGLMERTGRGRVAR